jgi:hypothetical protein
MESRFTFGAGIAVQLRSIFPRGLSMRLLLQAAALALLPCAALAQPAASASATPSRLESTAASAWVHDHLQGWPPKTVALAVVLVEKYGRPEDAGARRITWYDNGPWKRTSLLREAPLHNFPLPHEDVLEQTVDYKVPPKKVADLLSYDGSLVVDRTRGELTVHCNSEEMNILTLNIADDIVKGERSLEQAMAFHAQVIEGMFIHEPETYPQKLRFTPHKGTADPAEEAQLLEHLRR